MSDAERRLTRRRFLEHSAMATAMTATWYSVAMKTDAIAQAPASNAVTPPGGASSYAYDDHSV